ncbi:NAD(P)H-binding protein [Cytobacillus purgationiresistens]|uniref:Uncharacterized protein YbjT (DUF2867 family) n=1 Tax=Cytobacillus purgationiresistens TaxID=863449 RepID=A0ABU0AB76_9BACI|nr:NAD(P)H-binding protein [Cytobacillus purgationiresistens]MDQ0268501.1 uncharacterized protein YbjT (DUF2867 family) [Cytobacillus purgationiresistens]
MKTALIAGSTGLVGNELLKLLLNKADYDKVYALVRRPLNIQHPKLIEVDCDFNNLENVKDYFAVNDVYCCLGTTIKKAKTKDAMYKIDVDYPYKMGKLAVEKEVNHFIIISSMNANARSKLFYPRIKGLLEDKLKTLPLHTLSIVRPSLILGNRSEKRFGEKVGMNTYKILSHFLSEQSKNKLAIEARDVAVAMAALAKRDSEGLMVCSSQDMAEIVKQTKK